ncbi:hypothetical protein M501DRAFT_1021784 [Patellaria atrata CBS 101060]|uniref:SET domain-containing protein n=1 Tax=Patellaria atrata CBS 101060 TaxID=1346257 RepID=A0A9P4VX64_9PEZI|nr:hypothetical protein M501DRAFT_1021784 [Patellaria atrata CBS 101060]
MPATTSTAPTTCSSELDLPLFTIQPVPHKGKGLVTHCNIARGTRILAENPLFICSTLQGMSSLESEIPSKLKSLPKDQQRQFLSLHNSYPTKYPFSGIQKTNALPCGPDSILSDVYPNICLINHSWSPNAHHSWNSDMGYEIIHAIRSISVGEEIKFLDNWIGDSLCVMTVPEKCLAYCYTLLKNLQAEFEDSTHVLITRLYYDASQIAITHGDQARASIFAKRAYETRVVCEGKDSPETGEMKCWMITPANHRNFGASRRWKTTKKMVPKGTNPDQFEEWLWRRGK